MTIPAHPSPSRQFRPRKRHAGRFFLRLVLFLAAAGALALLIPRAITYLVARPKMYTAGQVPPARAAIVLGAGLQRDGTPSAILRDRVATAAQLYFDGKVEKLLMSGDNRFLDYNEPGAMRSYAVSLGVPAEDIVLDYAGRRTYDTCYRAKHIFGLDGAVVVTQRFHLYRALFLCSAVGLDATGVAADRRPVNPIWRIREIPATTVAVWEAWVSHPLPVLGEPEPIF